MNSESRNKISEATDYDLPIDPSTLCVCVKKREIPVSYDLWGWASDLSE